MAHPEDYEEKLELYKGKIEHDVWEWRRGNVDADLIDMAEGGVGGTVGGGKTIRSKFFPDWEDEDFADLVEKLAEHEKDAIEEALIGEAEELLARIVARAKMYGIDKRVFRDIAKRAFD